MYTIYSTKKYDNISGMYWSGTDSTLLNSLIKLNEKPLILHDCNLQKFSTTNIYTQSIKDSYIIDVDLTSAHIKQIDMSNTKIHNTSFDDTILESININNVDFLNSTSNEQHPIQSVNITYNEKKPINFQDIDGIKFTYSSSAPIFPRISYNSAEQFTKAGSKFVKGLCTINVVDQFSPLTIKYQDTQSTDRLFYNTEPTIQIS